MSPIQKPGTVAAKGPVKPYEFFLPPPKQALPGVVIPPAFYDETINPNFDITLNQGFLMAGAVAEPNLGDNVEVPPSLFVIGGTWLMGWRGYYVSQRILAQSQMDEGIERLPDVVITTFNDWTELDQQRAWDLQFDSDDTYDDGLTQLLWNGWDTDADQQMWWMATVKDLASEPNLGDNPESPIIALTTGWDTDAEQQRDISWRIGDDVLDAGVETIISPAFDFATVPKDEDQFPGWVLPFDSDDVYDDGVVQISITGPWDMVDIPWQVGWVVSQPEQLDSTNYIILPLNVWDNDTENQKSNEYNNNNLASDSGQNSTNYIILPFNPWDGDQDRQDHTWKFTSDDQLDSQIEKIQLPNTAWDNDVDEQLTWNLGFTSDSGEPGFGDNPELPPALTSGSDVILMGYKGYRIQKSMMVSSDESVGIPITTPFDQATIPKDEDQFRWLVNTIFDDTFDCMVEELPSLYTIPSQILMGWRGYYVPQRILAQSQDNDVELKSTSAFDFATVPRDEDQSKWWDLQFNSDDIYDDGLTQLLWTGWDDQEDILQISWSAQWELGETTNFIILPFNDFTTDAENQLDRSWKQIDDNFDPVVESIQIVTGWDNDSDQQLDNTWRFSRDDENDLQVEKIFLPANIWDTDADQQKLQPSPFGTDTTLDESIERIQIALTTGWDTDAEQQMLWLLSFGQDTLSDEEVEIIILPPFVDEVDDLVDE